MPLSDGNSDAATDDSDCPFPDCDWTNPWEDRDWGDQLTIEGAAEDHYHEEHAGKVKLQMSFAQERPIGDVPVEAYRSDAIEMYEEEIPGWELQHVRSEVIKEPDDHELVTDGGTGASDRYQIELTEEQVEALADALTQSATYIYESGEANTRDAMGEALKLREEIKRQRREQKYD